MPTYLRLIIMLGEVIGFYIFSFIRCRQDFKAYKEDKNNETNRSNLKVSIIYYSICNSLILFIFIWSFYSYIFLSYSKLILVTIAVITSLLPYIFSKCMEKHDGIATLLFFIFIIGAVYSIVITIFSFCAPEQLIQFKTCINEESFIETIDPEIGLTEKSKVGYSLDDSGEVDSYIFFYKDNSDNWCKVDEPIEYTKKLSDDENSYVEKCVTKRTFLNYELDESDDNYIITEEIVSYELYYNPNELIVITD